MQATTVAATGSADAPFTIATFSLALSDKGATVPVAKANLKKQIEMLTTVLDNLKGKHSIEFVANSIRTTSQTQEDYEYDRKNNENKFVGYIVNYNYSFQVDNLDVVNDIYDVLTSLDKVSVSSPSFGLKPAQREKLSKKALKNAFAKVKERFETECKILTLQASDFEIFSWEVTYADSQRSNRVAGAKARAFSNSRAVALASAVSLGGGVGDEDTSLDLVSGLAEVVVNLEVGYARKTSQVSVSTVS
jgi:uncharacterized protein YggE